MELLYFVRPGCPYCRQADYILAELVREHPEYERISIRRVDETREVAFASEFDYWYVPSFFRKQNKLYEADPAESEESVRKKLEAVFREAFEMLDQ